ncbi:MAG: helix-turn-helix domain-containing protein [Campylobacterota bacterium]|nr:helix-turn-helix domain-containing protein [Campylobacterota bacterium]
MTYDIYPPDKKLVNIVKQYFVIKDIGAIESMLFLPNGGNFLVFNRGVKATIKFHTGESHEMLPGYSIGMKASKAKKVIIDRGAYLDNVLLPIILVELLPIGYYKLFFKDASVLTTSNIVMSEDTIDAYFNRLYLHNTIDDEINYLNQSLIEMDAANNNTHLLIEDIMKSIVDNHHFDVTIVALMKEFKYTRKTMERQFKKCIGLTPKNFIYLAKFCKTFLKYVDEAKKLKDIQYRYSDNAHFNTVFQNITGFAPSELFKDVVENNDIQIYQMKQKRL